MDSETRPFDARSDRCLIPDLRGVALEQLVSRVTSGEKDVTSVVSRIVGSWDNPCGVPAMMFNSTI